MSSSGLIFSNTAVQLLGKAFNISADLIVTFLITRSLGAITYSNFAKVLSLVTLFYLFLDFGFNAIVVRRLGKKPDSLSRQFSTLLVLRLVYALILFIFLCLILFLLPHSSLNGFTSEVKLASLIFGLSFFFQGIFTSANSIFQHRLNYLPVVVSSSVSSLLTLILVLFAISFSPNLLGITLAHLLGTFILATINLFFALRLVNFNPALNLTAYTRLIKETLPLGIMLILNAAMSKLDTILVTLFRPTLEVGWLNLSYRIYDTLLVLPQLVLNILYPVMVRHHQFGIPNLRYLVFKSSKLLLFASIILATMIFISSPLLIIFGSDLLPAATSLKILSFFLPFFFVTTLLQWTALTLYQEKLLIKIYGLGLIFNASANLILIPRFGYLAAALTTGLTELLVFILLLTNLLKFLHPKGVLHATQN